MQSAPGGPPSRDVKDLSREEGERLSAEQQELHPNIERINAWAVEHPELFAGVWLDNSGFLDGTGPVRIGVGLAGREQYDATSDVAALLDHPTRLVVVDKGFPEVVLRAAQERVVARWMSSGPAGRSPRYGLRVDIHANALEVMLSQPDEGLEAQIRSENREVPITIAYGHASWA
jgi:hypothetical protein